VRVRDPLTGQVVEQTVLTEVQIDEGLLRAIAERTSGGFFRATDAASLREIFARIDALEKSEIRQTAYRRYRELFFPVLLAAAATLAASGALWTGGLRVTPA
jgi:Ca-activated chloride channel family protein